MYDMVVFSKECKRAIFFNYYFLKESIKKRRVRKRKSKTCEDYKHTTCRMLIKK